jgi:ribose transport system ATP-binding protein
VQALSNVSLDLCTGEILALVGENGAGKSTLIQVLAGAVQPDAGQVFLNGSEVHFSHPHEAAEAGISVVYQELSLVNNLSVAENIFAGRQPASAGLISVSKMQQQAQTLLDAFEVDFRPRDRVGALSMGNQQMIEIMKALSRNARVLVLDEPTSSLSLQEASLLFKRLRQLRAQGFGIIYVSHHLEEVMEISDRVAVLRDGEMVGVVNTADTTEAGIVSMMVGRSLNDWNLVKEAAARGDEYLRVSGLSRASVFKDVSFSAYAGQVLTFFGLVGAGRTEMARCIVGMDQATGGAVEVKGKSLRLSHPADAMRSGLAYLSEDRKREGLYLAKSVKENFLVTNLLRVAPHGWLKWSMLDEITRRYAAALQVRTPSFDQRLRNLSGGNQQKVLLGIWLATEPDVLIVDEPTRGIDVGTKQEIHRILRELAAQGKAVIVISSDLPEALAISDRIAVMRRGRLVGEMKGAGATQESIMQLAAGVATQFPTPMQA